MKFKTFKVFLLYLIFNIVTAVWHPANVMASVMLFANTRPTDSEFTLWFLMGSIGAIPNLIFMVIALIIAYFIKYKLRPHLFWGIAFAIFIIIGYLSIYVISII